MTLASERKRALLLIVAVVAFAGSGLTLGQSQGQSTPPSTSDQHRKEVRLSEAESRQGLMKMVQPIYPPTAKQRGIERTVVLDADRQHSGQSRRCAIRVGGPHLRCFGDGGRETVDLRSFGSPGRIQDPRDRHVHPSQELRPLLLLVPS